MNESIRQVRNHKKERIEVLYRANWSSESVGKFHRSLEKLDFFIEAFGFDLDRTDYEKAYTAVHTLIYGEEKKRGSIYNGLIKLGEDRAREILVFASTKYFKANVRLSKRLDFEDRIYEDSIVEWGRHREEQHLGLVVPYKDSWGITSGTSEIVELNQGIVSNIRVWDYLIERKHKEIQELYTKKLREVDFRLDGENLILSPSSRFQHFVSGKSTLEEINHYIQKKMYVMKVFDSINVLRNKAVAEKRTHKEIGDIIQFFLENADKDVN